MGSPEELWRGVRIGAMTLVAVGMVAGCTGENLFTGPALGGGLTGPTVEITAPAPDATFAQGDSVQVTADVSSANGISQVTFSGVFSTGTTAFVSEVVTLPSPADTVVSNFLQQAGTATGSAKIIVEARDVLGSSAADTVAIEIVN